MNVRPLYPIAAARYQVASGKSERTTPSTSGRPQLRKVTDHLILSERARAVLDEMRSHPDVNTSIRAGMQDDQLSAERTHEVENRIKTGVYHDPYVLHQVASSVSTAIAYKL